MTTETTNETEIEMEKTNELATTETKSATPSIEEQVATWRGKESTLVAAVAAVEGVTIATHAEGPAKGRKAVDAARLSLKHLRTGIESERKALKVPIVALGQLVDREAKRLTAIVEPRENALAREITEWDAEQARIAKEAEEAERNRVDDLVALLVAAEHSPIVREDVAAMEPEAFAELLSAAQSAKAEREAEKARLEAEELERQRVEREAREAEDARNRAEAEAAREAAEKAEAERVKAEAEARALREELEAMRREKAEAERLAEVARVEAEARAQREIEEATIREREAREAAERKEREAREEADRIEREKLEAEERAEHERMAEIERQREAEAEAARIEAQRPDREKIAAWCKVVVLPALPEIADYDLRGALELCVVDIRNRINQLEREASDNIA